MEQAVQVHVGTGPVLSRRNSMNTWMKWVGTVLTTALLAACQSAPRTPAPVEPVKAAPAPVAEVTPAVNDKSKAGLLAPMIERRDTLVATGYAVISVQNHKNPAQQRLLAIRAAKLDAYRALTEQVYGQHLDATTTVSDMTVMSDTFRARVEGVVYGAVLVSITPAGDDTYEATLSLDRSVVNDLRALYLGQLVSSR
jgi:outer membrane protein FlgP